MEKTTQQKNNKTPQKSGNRSPRNNTRPDRRREEKEFEEKLLDLRRVTRVTAGGKRFSFSAVMVLGDKKGRVGIGVAKGLDVPGAIAKAKAIAEKNMFKLDLSGNTINHEVHAKFCASKVVLKPATVGHGLVAGGSVRVVCSLVGIKDISAKIVGTSSNKLNNAQATLLALKKIRSSPR